MDSARPEGRKKTLAHKKKAKLKKKTTATYTNERQEGYGKLHLISGLEIAWHLHGEVLLWLVIRRREDTWELGVERSHIEDVAENF